MLGNGHSVSQPTEVQPFYIKTRAQCLAPLHMYLTWLGTAIYATPNYE